MALIKGKARQSTAVARLAEGTDVYLRALRDGTLSVSSFIGALSLEGRVFTANAGTGTTTIAYGAGGLDTTEFDLHVAVPAGSVIIPLSLRITFAAIGTAAVVECCMQSGSGSITGTGTAVTPQSSSVSSGLTSACTVTSAAGTGTALTTNVKEIWRESDQLGITIATVAQLRVKEVFTWEAMEAGVLDVVGPTQQLVVFAAANAGTGFICLKYAELPASAVK